MQMTTPRVPARVKAGMNAEEIEFMKRFEEPWFNISSVAAVCSVGIIACKTSEAALNAFAQSLAIGNARYNVRANAIMPGHMNTPMAIEGYVAAGRDRGQRIAERNAQVPLGAQMGSAWDVANAALFLASDEAKFITGVCLAVDGGQSARVG